MRVILTAAILVFLSFPANAADMNAAAMPGYQTKIIEHGGGCRKSSPPGQCCHMDHKTGIVHCH